MISLKHKFIFFHNPRTGGTSIETALAGYCEKFGGGFGAPYAKHATLDQMRAGVGEIDFDRFYKFCFVRNPWARVYSLYHWGVSIYSKKEIGSDRDVLGIRNWAGIAFKDWVAQVYAGGDLYRKVPLWGVQVPLIRCPGSSALDHVGRFETIKADFDRVCKDLGIEAELPHVYKAAKGTHHDAYDDAARKYVADIFDEDIRAFGYAFDKD